jgi:hypothetical protein
VIMLAGKRVHYGRGNRCFPFGRDDDRREIPLVLIEMTPVTHGNSEDPKTSTMHGQVNQQRVTTIDTRKRAPTVPRSSSQALPLHPSQTTKVGQLEVGRLLVSRPQERLCVISYPNDFNNTQ